MASCTVALKNNRFYADAGPAGAFYFDSFDKVTGQLNYLQWSTMRQGMICESTDVFTNLKDVVQALCNNTHSCSYDQQQNEDQFMSKISTATKEAKP